MKRETITLMQNSIDDGYISEADVFDPDSIQEPPERIVHMKKGSLLLHSLRHFCFRCVLLHMLQISSAFGLC